MSFRNFISEQFILPLSDLITGNSVAKYLHFLEKSNTWTPEQIVGFQNEKLRALIKHAVEHVPYYRDLFKQLGLKAEDIQTKTDLCKIPIVDKSIMRKEGTKRFTADNIDEKQMMLCRSSGSTGEPFSFYVSKEAYSFNLAAKLQAWYKAGYRLGDKYVKIGVGNGRTTKIKKIQDRVNNCELIPYFALNDNDLDRILGKIECFKPLYIRSYPSPLYSLAMRKIVKKDCFAYCPQIVFTTGSTLPASYREVIEKAFGCRVIDSYSCEGCPNVSQEESDYYRVCREYGIVEVVNNKESNGCALVGRSVVTDFWNYAHPFIRYDTQDLVEVSDVENKPFPVAIKRIMGRECQSFCTKSGRLLTEHEFTTMKYSNIVDAYQIVRKKNGGVSIRVVPNVEWSTIKASEFNKYWEKQLEMPVDIEIVPEIPIMKNNKRLTIVDE